MPTLSFWEMHNVRLRRGRFNKWARSTQRLEPNSLGPRHQGAPCAARLGAACQQLSRLAPFRIEQDTGGGWHVGRGAASLSAALEQEMAFCACFFHNAAALLFRALACVSSLTSRSSPPT